jgi:hypothetical protein
MFPQPDNQTLSLILSDRLQELNWDSFSDADWDALAHKAYLEGVAPLLYWIFSRSEGLSSLPQSARNFLRISYASTWMRNQKNLKELEVLSRLFARAEIPMVVLKGICFALSIYPDIGLRPMGDMDILVPGPKLSEAVRLARTLGYEDAKPEASPNLWDLLYHEICLQKRGPLPITLELHHSLVADKTYTYAVPVDWFWGQTESLATSSSQMKFENLLMLTPAAQVLYAASHAMLQHGGKSTSMCWFYDMDRLIRHYDGRMDWDKLLSQAKIFEWGSALHAALTQTCAYFNTPIPDHVRVSLLEKTDRHQQLVALKQTRPATHILEEHQELLSLNWYGRFRLVLALIAPTPAYMRWRYQLKSSWALLAYYPIRWWGIAKDAFNTMIALVKRPPETRT